MTYVDGATVLEFGVGEDGLHREAALLQGRKPIH